MAMRFRRKYPFIVQRNRLLSANNPSFHKLNSSLIFIFFSIAYPCLCVSCAHLFGKNVDNFFSPYYPPEAFNLAIVYTHEIIVKYSFKNNLIGLFSTCFLFYNNNNNKLLIYIFLLLEKNIRLEIDSNTLSSIEFAALLIVLFQKAIFTTGRDSNC
jgi:hypothetical protein